MRTVIAVLCSLLPLGCGTHLGAPGAPEQAVRSSYDAARGTTRVRAAVVYRSLAPPHTVDLSKDFEGTRPPSQIWDAILTFSTSEAGARGLRFRENHSLLIVLDEGEPIRYHGVYEGAVGASIATETVRFRVSLDDLRRIAASGVVRGHLGSQEFEWRGHERAVVASFLSALRD
jgi:hypothetical protein